MDEKDAIAVFTARSPKRILEEGGSQAWVLNPARAKLATWLVVTQNRHNPDHEFSDATEPHGAAFMVGKISGISRSGDGPNRWLIEIDEYAEVAVPDAWQHWRNPVRYTTLEEMGIDPRKLQFKPVPRAKEEKAGASAPAAAHAPAGLTIAEAKKALAATYGVKPEAIEITIRG